MYKSISLEIENSDQIEESENLRNVKIEPKKMKTQNAETPKSQFRPDDLDHQSRKKSITLENSFQSQISPKNRASHGLYSDQRRLKKISCKDSEKLYFFYPLDKHILTEFWNISSIFLFFILYEFDL